MLPESTGTVAGKPTHKSGTERTSEMDSESSSDPRANEKDGSELSLWASFETETCGDTGAWDRLLRTLVCLQRSGARCGLAPILVRRPS